ncbi:glycosyltransferase [Longitalea luteola]|uniref:glycosyltransferase n=1 Tax=Longitalea luteola TaxID=2812563 RepID=UPI001A977ED0|nr:glycosyltransferase [Longitalea luteola]
METDSLRESSQQDSISLKGKRLLICEEGLLDYKGHFYSWIKAIRAIHLEAGAEVLVASNLHVDKNIQAEFNAIPTYSRNNWSGIYDHKQAWRRYFSVFAHNFRVWRETRKLLRKTGPVDCILLPAVRIHNLMAWRKLCGERLGRDFGRLVLFQLTSEAIYDESYTRFHFKRTANLIKFVLRGFRKQVAAGKVILAGDSHITCNEYQTLSGVPFRVFPSPVAGLQAANPLSTSASKSDIPTFVILGVSFIDKGIDLLQEAIIQLLKNNPDLEARFVIQWATPTIDYNGQPVPIKDELRNAAQVTLIERVLNEEEYRSYLQSAHFVVLPYRRKVYFNRLSGVAVEAACAGIPMIVTENTWLEWAMKEFGAGVTVRDGDAKDLADKIKLCIQERLALQTKALQRRNIAMEKNSSIFYLKRVWE